MSNSIYKAFVFGLGPSGLFLTRELRKEGFSIIGIGKNDDIGRYSNSLEEVFVTVDPKEILQVVKLETENFTSKPIAYVCSDQYLTMFIEDIPEIFKRLDFAAPSQDLLCLIADKERLIDLHDKVFLKFPKRFKFAADINACDFPIICKPNIKRGQMDIEKISFINNQEELELFLSRIESLGMAIDDFIIQQCIVGNNDREYGYGGYFCNGHPVVDIYFVQARQYPQGICCYIMELNDKRKQEQIKEVVGRFLFTTKYSGFIQFDVKENADGEIYVLDVNPRPWGSINMLRGKIMDGSVFAPLKIRQNTLVRWRFPFKELFAITNKRNMSYRECRKYLKGIPTVNIIDLYDKSDIKPFLMQPIVALKKLF